MAKREHVHKKANIDIGDHPRLEIQYTVHSTRIYACVPDKLQACEWTLCRHCKLRAPGVDQLDRCKQLQPRTGRPHVPCEMRIEEEFFELTLFDEKKAQAKVTTQNANMQANARNLC